MTVWYRLWSFGILFPFWYVWTKKNLATLTWPASGRLPSWSQGDQIGRIFAQLLIVYFGQFSENLEKEQKHFWTPLFLG
jgi:hypothetical protein